MCASSLSENRWSRGRGFRGQNHDWNTVIEGEVAIGTIEEETFTAQSLTNEQLLLL